jgi:putative ABC transport system permease protein
MVTVHGVDKQIFDKFRNYNLSPEALEKFRATRDGAVIGAVIAKRKSWKVGQQVDLRAQLGLFMTITGIFVSGNEEFDNAVITGIEYAQDMREMRGQTNLIYVKVRDGASAEQVAKQIDAMPLPVSTMTNPEKTFMGNMIEDLNDMMRISQIVILIALAVVLTGIANTISMSARDRTQQIGVMRALGFKRRTILGMILAESAMMSITGGVVGCLAAFALFMFQDITVQTRMYNFSIPISWLVVTTGLGIALAVGLLGGILPAYNASRLKIIDSLRSVD